MCSVEDLRWRRRRREREGVGRGEGEMMACVFDQPASQGCSRQERRMCHASAASVKVHANMKVYAKAMTIMAGSPTYAFAMPI